jgi:hypothetical protein
MVDPVRAPLPPNPALELLREALAILDRHAAARQYIRTAGLLEPRLPGLERAVRALVARDDETRPKPAPACPDCGDPRQMRGHRDCYPPPKYDGTGRRTIR